MIGESLPFDTLAQLRLKMFEFTPILAHIGHREKSAWSAFGNAGSVSAKPFAPVIKNFYMTDPICRASVTMAKCTEEILPLTMQEAAE